LAYRHGEHAPPIGSNRKRAEEANLTDNLHATSPIPAQASGQIMETDKDQWKRKFDCILVKKAINPSTLPTLGDLSSGRGHTLPRDL
jgi:hypothetical protein